MNVNITRECHEYCFTNIDCRSALIFKTIYSLFLSLSICFFVFPATSMIWLVCALRQCFSFRSNVRTPAKDSDSPLPSIHERLAYLRPSRELLEFYRQKIAQFDEEHVELQQMLEQHRRSTEEQVRRSKSTRRFRGPCVMCDPF